MTQTCVKKNFFIHFVLVFHLANFYFYESQILVLQRITNRKSEAYTGFEFFHTSSFRKMIILHIHILRTNREKKRSGLYILHYLKFKTCRRATHLYVNKITIFMP